MKKRKFTYEDYEKQLREILTPPVRPGGDILAKLKEVAKRRRGVR